MNPSSSRRSSLACAARAASSTASARPSATASVVAVHPVPEVIRRQEIKRTICFAISYSAPQHSNIPAQFGVIHLHARSHISNLFFTLRRVRPSHSFNFLFKLSRLSFWCQSSRDYILFSKTSFWFHCLFFFLFSKGKCKNWLLRTLLKFNKFKNSESVRFSLESRM
jgi:hypothetical protein